ncbi:hypothetical protein BGX38DRAFT_726261 [Terfezia claveryi]|nr:hypothetical protein BGX38DRAFT_726261 [Terfezia claveryi]
MSEWVLNKNLVVGERRRREEERKRLLRVRRPWKFDITRLILPMHAAPRHRASLWICGVYIEKEISMRSTMPYRVLVAFLIPGTVAAIRQANGLVGFGSRIGNKIQHICNHGVFVLVLLTVFCVPLVVPSSTSLELSAFARCTIMEFSVLSSVSALELEPLWSNLSPGATNHIQSKVPEPAVRSACIEHGV